MVNNCFVSNLQFDANELLPRVGYCHYRIKADSPVTLLGGDQLKIQNPGSPLIIDGDGYFTDASGNNIGKELNDRIGPNYNGIHVGSEIMLHIKPYGSSPMSVTIDSKDLKWELDSEQFKYLYDKAIIQSFIFRPTTVKGNINDLISKLHNGNNYIIPTEVSPYVVGNINDAVLDDNLWFYTVSLKNMPNIVGDIESLLNQAAQKQAASDNPHNLAFELVNCPNLRYGGSSVGMHFIQIFRINLNGTWEEKSV